MMDASQEKGNCESCNLSTTSEGNQLMIHSISIQFILKHKSQRNVSQPKSLSWINYWKYMKSMEKLPSIFGRHEYIFMYTCILFFNLIQTKKNVVVY